MTRALILAALALSGCSSRVYTKENCPAAYRDKSNENAQGVNVGLQGAAPSTTALNGAAGCGGAP